MTEILKGLAGVETLSSKILSSRLCLGFLPQSLFETTKTPKNYGLSPFPQPHARTSRLQLRRPGPPAKATFFFPRDVTDEFAACAFLFKLLLRRGLSGAAAQSENQVEGQLLFQPLRLRLCRISSPKIWKLRQKSPPKLPLQLPYFSPPLFAAGHRMASPLISSF
ncbi:hypothetical protein U1Q18_014853 [Sarracenia purpurea var. burkii]